MTQRKDRLIQTRVPEKLESTLKDEAKRRRTTVSQMIRNILEDSFDLVDGVVANVDQIVVDSVELAQKVGRDARRIGQIGQDIVRDIAPCRTPLSDAEERLAGVQAWNEVVLNQHIACTKCGAELPRGRKAFTGIGDSPDDARAWICTRSVELLTLEHREPVEHPALAAVEVEEASDPKKRGDA
jgi:hypothetical protein